VILVYCLLGVSPASITDALQSRGWLSPVSLSELPRECGGGLSTMFRAAHNTAAKSYFSLSGQSGGHGRDCAAMGLLGTGLGALGSRKTPQPHHGGPPESAERRTRRGPSRRLGHPIL